MPDSSSLHVWMVDGTHVTSLWIKFKFKFKFLFVCLWIKFNVCRAFSYRRESQISVGTLILGNCFPLMVTVELGVPVYVHSL